ncbi:MAG: DUF6982 domain-containing protein [Thermoanaerobaculia bacterium]
MNSTPSSSVPVVLHFRGGRTEHVYAPPQIDPGRQTVAVTGDDGSAREVPFSELKAVFFLADPDATSVPESPAGSTLAVEFQDGELIRGTAHYDPSASGFFLFPHDRRKNDRVFVVNSAVVSIDVEKL